MHSYHRFLAAIALSLPALAFARTAIYPTGKATSGTVTPRHGGGTNMLYGGGHVRTFSAAETAYANGSSAVKAEIENWFRL